MKSVYVVGGDRSVVKMFEQAGWDVWTRHISRIGDKDYKISFDLVCFTGGEDVSPHLYGEENISSHTNEARDNFEIEVYEEFRGKVPMVGICRGGQLLNVLNGGKMIQDLPKRQSGDVECYIDWGLEDGFEDVILRVDHHQGMVRNPEGEIHGATFNKGLGRGIDYSLFYPETKCWSFQPHPEWGHEPTKELFFKLLDEYIGV